MTTLTVKNLSAVVEGKLLFEHLNVQFLPGQVWGILGPNGIGKTTLLHTLAGLRYPNEGQVLCDETDLHQLKLKKRAKKIGLLLQEVEFSFPTSVFEMVRTGRYPHQTHWFRHSQADAWWIQQSLEKMNLSSFAQRSVTSLSGGERRRLMLATLLAQNPDIYLLDEPTNHLDIQQQMQALMHFRWLAKQKNKIVIWVSHDIHLLNHFCDNVILLEQDKKVSIGPKFKILNKTMHHRFFSEEFLSHCINAD